ncbi:hypothetical protein [Effusibacillus consociatus]|uniref:Uncharacterized protein n=1 Tax=Effusibacillus consociatus TaxID=1117041 RepID=A0ABV9Q7V2_9BACL
MVEAKNGNNELYGFDRLVRDSCCRPFDRKQDWRCLNWQHTCSMMAFPYPCP